jgi:hypothetical protein
MGALKAQFDAQSALYNLMNGYLQGQQGGIGGVTGTGPKTLVNPVVTPWVSPWHNLDEPKTMAFPAFESGGDHYGGWRIVGENGPELEATGAARYYNAEQTKSIMSKGSADNKELVAEVKGMREEVANIGKRLDRIEVSKRLAANA